jgi:hypothetical protein
MKQLSKYTFCIALIALVWIPVQVSAQTLTAGQFHFGHLRQTHYQPQRSRSPLCSTACEQSFRSGSSNDFWGRTQSGWAMEHA